MNEQTPGPSDETPLPVTTPQPSRPRNFKKVGGIAAIILLVIGALLLHKLAEPKKANYSKTKVTTAKTSQTNKTNKLRLLATGDFIAHDSLNLQAKKPDGSYDYLQFMNDFVPFFSTADIRFCNQATVSGGEPYGISGYPVFNAPAQFAKDMGKVGCNLINTASNHSFDKGQAAIDSTLKTWDGVPNILAIAGENRSSQEQNTIKYFTIKDVKCAFLAYTTYSNSAPSNGYGVNMYSRGFASSQIARVKQAGAQIIIVSMRWGTEYSPTVNAQQLSESQFLADQGASVILGHGPHVLQTVKKLKGAGGNDSYVWYSLGNFINTQEPPETLFNGLAIMDFDIKTKQITAVSYLPIYMHYAWTPAQKAAGNLLARNNLHLYLLENTTQSMIDKNQLPTTVAAQRERIQATLNANIAVPLITTEEYNQ